MSKLKSLFRRISRKSKAGMVLQDEVETSFKSLFPNGISNSRPVQGFVQMSRFYTELRGDGAAPFEQDGDMLLFQYGTFDFGDGPKFDLNLTRQLIFGNRDDDQEIWQLQLTYSFLPESDWDKIGSHSSWCPDPENLGPFMQIVLNSDAVKKAEKSELQGVNLLWENT